MPRRPTLAHPPVFSPGHRDGPRVTFTSDTGAVAHVFVLEADVVRVLLLAAGAVTSPPSWAVAPGADDVADPGRDRMDVAGFSAPDYDVANGAAATAITTAALRLTVDRTGFLCTWHQRTGECKRWTARDGDGDGAAPSVAPPAAGDGAGWTLIARDRRTQAYNFGWWDAGAAYHYQERLPGDRHYGLGEVAGPLDRTGRRVRLAPVDAMGYDAAASDPLYKAIPLLVVANPAAGTVHAQLHDTAADVVFDVGAEHDNYHPPYRYVRAASGDVDVYMVAGATPLDVVARATWLTGRPALAPRWLVRYSGSTMTYTDAPDAAARMAGFLELCARHDVPVGSFHLSSGYTTVGGGGRHVFQWDTRKFPDPAAFFESYARAGVRVLPNIKPALRLDHPEYGDVAAAGYFISVDDDGDGDGDGDGGSVKDGGGRDSGCGGTGAGGRRDGRDGGGDNGCGDSGGDGCVGGGGRRDARARAPALIQFWGALASHVDFTNPAAAAWWRDRVTASLLSLGAGGTWNDNNECGVRDPRALAAGFGARRAAAADRPVHALLMARASRAAQLAASPTARPAVVTRSGPAGVQRYAATWSGDNATAWRTIAFNAAMGAGLALCGVSHAGHDVGGFAGPAPDPELFVRWVQAGVVMPRCVIHSWNDDGTVNEPWMHAAAAPAVAALLRWRDALVPFLHDLLWRHHAACAPVTRPLWLNWPAEPRAWDDATAAAAAGAVDGGGACVAAVHALGDDVVVALAAAPGATAVRLWVPPGAWRDVRSDAVVDGGRDAALAAPLEGLPPLLARVGSGLLLDAAPTGFAASRVQPRQPVVLLYVGGAAGGGGAPPPPLVWSGFDEPGDGTDWPDPTRPPLWRVRVDAERDRLAIGAEWAGAAPPPAPALWLALPADDRREVTLNGEACEARAVSVLGVERRVVVYTV